MTVGFQICAVDHSVFIKRHTHNGDSVVLAVYVDYILLTDNDTTRIMGTKEYLRKHFVTNDMGRPRYFLGIEFPYGRDKMVLT